MTALSSGLFKLTAAGLLCGGLLTLAAGAQKEILRLGCSCLLVILLLSLLQAGELPSLDLSMYRTQIQPQVEESSRQTREKLLEQTCRALEQELVKQSSALGLSCDAQVVCTADPAGVVTVTQVHVAYRSGPREQLTALRQWIAQQLSVSDGAILIQEGGQP